MHFINKHLLPLLLALLSFTAVAEDTLTFSLNRMENNTPTIITEKDFEGKYLLVAIGFTGCPDICPTTLLDMKGALRALKKHPEAHSKLQAMFVTIDPEQDTLKDITQYTRFFNPSIVGLRTDSFDTLDNFVEQLNASYGYIHKGRPVFPPNLPKGYTVVHSTYIYLYSPERTLLDAFPYNLPGKRLAEKLLPYLQK